MRKTIIVARGNAKGLNRYVSSSQTGRLTDNVSEAALFASAENAQAAVGPLLERDIEGKQDCELFLAEVDFVVIGLRPIERPPACGGWVIRRAKGDFYKGPKTRNARNFQEAHYKYVGNPAAATAFATRELALERAKAIQAVLDETATRAAAADRAQYECLARSFAPTLVERA